MLLNKLNLKNQGDFLFVVASEYGNNIYFSSLQKNKKPLLSACDFNINS